MVQRRLDRLLVVDRGTSDQIRFRYVGLTTQVAQVVDHDAGSAVIRSIANDWNGNRLVDWTGSGANQRFYGTNAHRDVTWTASDTGTVTNTLRYDPWGTLTNSSGTALPDFRFQGNWFDTSTNLAWIVTRWYAPALARFISEDSLLGDPADPPSRHLYAYGLGDPINFVDPNGRAAAFLVDGGYGEGASSWTAAKVKGHMQTRSRNKKYARVRSGAIVYELGRRAPVANTKRIGQSLALKRGVKVAAGRAHAVAIGKAIQLEPQRRKVEDRARTKEIVAARDRSFQEWWAQQSLDVRLTLHSQDLIGDAVATTVDTLMGRPCVDDCYYEAGLSTQAVAKILAGLSGAGRAAALARAARMPLEHSPKGLRTNLVKAGQQANGHAHHIVAGTRELAADARLVLARYEIGINDAMNGIFLPAAFHLSRTTTNLYTVRVNELLTSATSREQVVFTLRFIADELAAGRLP